MKAPFITTLIRFHHFYRTDDHELSICQYFVSAFLGKSIPSNKITLKAHTQPFKGSKQLFLDIYGARLKKGGNDHFFFANSVEYINGLLGIELPTTLKPVRIYLQIIEETA